MISTRGLATEFGAAADAVRQPHLDRLVALGVGWGVIDDLHFGDPPFGVLPVAPADDGLFVPSPNGTLHVVQPIYAEQEIIDLVAWTSADPTGWRLRTGLGDMLGDVDAMADQALWTPDIPTPLHATPLDWLRASGSGVCVINWSAPELNQLLRLPRIVTPDVSVAEALRSVLVRPIRIPEITVVREIRRAA